MARTRNRSDQAGSGGPTATRMTLAACDWPIDDHPRLGDEARDGADELLGIDVALRNARRRVGDPARLDAFEPKLREAIDVEFPRQRVRPWRVEAMALNVVANARQPRGDHAM